MAKISFVILTWNSENVISACLDSIAGMQLQGTEIILVDNGSADGTKLRIEQFISDHPGIPVHPVWLEKNYGTTISRNLGIKEADKAAEYICILGRLFLCGLSRRSGKKWKNMIFPIKDPVILPDI